MKRIFQTVLVALILLSGRSPNASATGLCESEPWKSHPTYPISSASILHLSFEDDDGTSFEVSDPRRGEAITRWNKDHTLRKCLLEKEKFAAVMKQLDGARLSFSDIRSVRRPWLELVLADGPYPRQSITVSHEKEGRERSSFFCEKQEEIFSSLKRLFQRVKKQIGHCKIVPEAPIWDPVASPGGAR